MCIVTSKCIVATIVMATAAILLLLAEHHRNNEEDYVGSADYVELTLNETHIEEQISIGN